jgi:hypothetical protein
MKNNFPDYDGPDDEKHKPLDRTPCKRLIEAAIETENVLDEVCVRVPLSTGLRNDELVHTKSKYIDTAYSDDNEAVVWHVEIPEFEPCSGGNGPNKSGKSGNPDGRNLHETGQPCSECRRRSVDGKDWLSERQKNKPGFSAKNENSVALFLGFNSVHTVSSTNYGKFTVNVRCNAVYSLS